MAHWVAVLGHGERLAVRTIEVCGDYAAAANVTVAMAEALIGPNRPSAGVFTPEAVLSLSQLAPALDRRGIHVVERNGAGAPLHPTDDRGHVSQAAS